MPVPTRLLALALLATALATAASAQVNTERMRGDRDGGLAVSLDAVAAYATGNAEYLRLGLGGRADLGAGAHSAFVVGRTDLSRADDRTFLDRSFLHARYGWVVAPRLTLETFAQVERNRQQRLVSRTLLGAGPRYQFVDQDSLRLALGVTPMFEHEELDAELEEPPAAVVRLSTYGTAQWTLNANTSLQTTTYLQPRADVPGDVRVLNQTALDVGITRAVRLRVQAQVRFDSRPPQSVERTDFSIENGLVFVLR